MVAISAFGCQRFWLFFNLQISLNFLGAWLQNLTLMVMLLDVNFISVEILGKIGYSFPVILQMVSLLGISKPGKHKAAALTKF